MIALGKILLIICDPPFQSDRVDKALKIADAALDKGHQVSIFLFMDGVYNMLVTQNGEHFRIESSADRLKGLMDKGADISCCNLCKELRGIEEHMMVEGVTPLGVSWMNDEMEDTNVVISFAGGI